MCRRALVVLAFVAGLPAFAQDVLTIGSGAAPPGAVATVPVHVRDVSGTPLDAGTGNRVQAFAFKVLFPTSVVSSVGFTRAGIPATVTPLFETTLQGSGFASVIVSFSAPLALNLDAASPGDAIGTLSVTLQGGASAGTTATLRIDPPSAMLSNQSASVRETVSAGSLALVNGSVTVALLATPVGVAATAVSASQVNVSWNAVAGADHYEVWRSSNNGPFAQLPNDPSGTSYSDNTVGAATTYLYRVRAIAGGGGASGFSAADPATTIVFTDDPVVAQSTTVKLSHITELRTAVNAFRASAGLGSLSADATIAAGAVVRAQHITALRTGLDQARSALGLAASSWTDAVPSIIRAAHVNELRSGVK